MDHNTHSLPSRQAGFSLIEALVSLTLIAVILALLPAALVAAKRGIAKASAMEAGTGSLPSLRFLETWLADAQPLFRTRVGARAETYFVGEPDRMAFLAPIDFAPFGAGLYHVELGRESGKNPNDGHLNLRIARYTPNATSPSVAVETRAVATNISGVRFRYFGPTPDQQGATWQSTWKNRTRTPLAVEIEMSGRENTSKTTHITLHSGNTLLHSNK